ncbi:MAG TPA: tryptophan--tRNA ligase [Acidimicrobiia bacterium]|nr:tryptophan--tRNA ligase [Acidimicrobiia bacterium]
MKRVFSGVQPTGNVHVGNYIGAFKNWVAMQEDWETIYCVVDLHAMTTPYEPADMVRNRIDMAKAVIACGVDPDRSLLYFQSHVPQHTELTWILSTITGIGQLERMTQYKEKSDRAGQNLGLLSYPVLMAADIVIHKVNAVPVGDDQTQHLELTRDLVERFNSRFGEEFPLPERITPEIGARVMSLQDPTAKMSKSDPNPASRILLTDGPDQISRKVKTAVTDSDRYVRYDWEEKPGVSNLLELASVFGGQAIDDLVAEYHDSGYGVFKEAVAEAIDAGLEPIRRRFEELDDADVMQIMDRNGDSARERAEAEMASVRSKVGLGR